MRLENDQVTTEEVKGWRGVHLLHFRNSSCSQKVRILLREKGVEWHSHPVDLVKLEQTKPWFLGINPRGVVPVLVHDGLVHVESNDILEYIDRELPPDPPDAPSYFPRSDEEKRFVAESLKLEDELHHDLRTMTMGFIVPQALAKRSPAAIKAYEDNGAVDAKRALEVEWWREYSEYGIPTEQAAAATRAFAAAFDHLEQRLAGREWLLGDRISVLEIAWFISVFRLDLAGYPIARHPRLDALYRRLLARPAFRIEVNAPAIERVVLKMYGAYRRVTRTALLDLVPD